MKPSFHKTKLHNDWVFRRGDVYCADPGKGSRGREALQGPVPVLVIQNDAGNVYSQKILTAEISTELDRVYIPTHVNIGTEGNLPEESVVRTENLMRLDKRSILYYLGHISPEKMKLVDEAIETDCDIDFFPRELEAP